MSLRPPSLLRTGIPALVCLAAGASRAFACATCYGQTDSALGRGLNWGIFALLVVVGMVIAGICSFFVFVARRAARLQAEDEQGRLSAQAKSSHIEKPV
jgi:hypothetical protein